MRDVTFRIPHPVEKCYSLPSLITFIPILQLQAYYAVLKHGLDPD